jgi:hypothetical protein
MDVPGTKNRLRSDDLEDLTVERFLQNAQIVNADGYAEGLGYWVFGKTLTFLTSTEQSRFFRRRCSLGEAIFQSFLSEQVQKDGRAVDPKSD